MTVRFLPALLAFALVFGPVDRVTDLASPQSAMAADSASAEISQLEVGFGGHYKVGSWTPLAVTIDKVREPVRARLIVEVPDPDGNMTELPSAEFDLEAGGPHRISTWFRTGRLEGEIRVRLVTDEAVLATRRVRAQAGGTVGPAVTQSVAIFATLGQPAGFPDDAAGKNSFSEALHRDFRVGALKSPAELPESETAYEGLNALIIAAGARSADGQLLLQQLSPAQNAALRDWVRLGGHLVLAIGADVEEYQKTLPAEWIPVPLEGISQLRRLDGLERFAGVRAQILFDGTVPAAKLGTVNGNVLAQGIDGPLLVQVPLGFGRVTLLAVDIDRPPLTEWEGLDEVLASVLDETISSARATRRTQSTQLSHLGVTDLFSQMYYAQEEFPSVYRISIWGVMGLIALYVVLIGPLDYLLVHRVLKRPEITWYTFPALVLLAVGLSIWGAQRANGGKLQMNQLDVIDVDVESQLLRGRSWLTLYSPETRRYQATIHPQTPQWGGSQAATIDTRPLVTWSAVPEDAIGGLYRPGGVQLSQRKYRYEVEGSAFENLPISIWSTKTVTGHWQHAQEGLLEVDLSSPGVGRLSGTLRSRLPVPLEDCVLAFGNRVYFPTQRRRGGERVSSLAPFSTWEVGRMGEQRELRGYLTKVYTKTIEHQNKPGSDILMQQTPYDPLSQDRTEIVQMMTFHQAAGGESYTGLHHDLLRNFDLSRQLRLGRAVLFARIDSAAAKAMIDKEHLEPDARYAFVRFLLPVKQIAAGELRVLPNPEDYTRQQAE